MSLKQIVQTLLDKICIADNRIGQPGSLIAIGKGFEPDGLVGRAAYVEICLDMHRFAQVDTGVCGILAKVTD